MQRRPLRFVLVAIGILILLVSLLADFIGVGGYPGIGYKQIIGIVIGIGIAILGWVMPRR